jgi:hypothetical protein
MNALTYAGFIEKSVEGARRGCESSRHFHTQARQVLDHFSKRSVLAANPRDIVHAKLIQWHNIF